MIEKDLDKLIDLFKGIEGDAFLRRCENLQGDCKGCCNRNCVANARVHLWLEKYRKTIINRVGNND